MTVEDGTGLADSNSYMTLDEADAYHELRGNSVWTDSTDDDAKEAALIRATAAVDTFAWTRWKGQRHIYTQALCWPRDIAYDDLGYLIEGIPTKLKESVAEAALVELSTAGVLSKKAETGIKRIKVGSIEKEYATESAVGASAYPTISRPLMGLVESNNGMKVVRV